MAIGHQLNNLSGAPGDNRPKGRQQANAGQRLRVVRLGQIPYVMQRPSHKAPSPIVVAGGKGQLRQGFVQDNPPQGQTAFELGLGIGGEPIEMVKAHVQGCLGAVGEVGVAKGLWAHTVAGAKFGAVVGIQPDIHAHIGLIAGAGNDMGDAYFLSGQQGPVNRVLVGYPWLEKRQLLPTYSSGPIDGFTGHNLMVETVRQSRADPQRGDETRPQVIAARAVEAQLRGRSRVFRIQRRHRPLHLIQNPGHPVRLGKEKCLKWLCHQAGLGERVPLPQHGPGKACVVGPGARELATQAQGHCQVETHRHLRNHTDNRVATWQLWMPCSSSLLPRPVQTGCNSLVSG